MTPNRSWEPLQERSITATFVCPDRLAEYIQISRHWQHLCIKSERDVLSSNQGRG